MSMISVLSLGLIIGMQHALQADHLAAVSTITIDNFSFRRVLSLGSFWGMGHAIALISVSGSILILGLGINSFVAECLEVCVGLMLVVLGGTLLYRLYRNRVHFHIHRHGGNLPHLHIHSHSSDTMPHQTSSHEHLHLGKGSFRAIIIGMMHGLAGSGALLVLTATATNSIFMGLIYITVFSLGSIFGMAILSMVFVFPLSRSPKIFDWINNKLKTSIGCGTSIFGGYIIFEHLPLIN